jgi:hypothetical protein
MEIDNNDFKVIIPKEKNWSIILYIGFCMLIYIPVVFILGVMCYKMITVHRIYDLVAPFFLFLIGGLFFLYIFLWQSFGKEILIINNDFVIIKRKGTLINFITKINREKIVRIDFNSGKETAWWIKFWGIGGGKIIIEYTLGGVEFGQSLIEQELIKVRFGQSLTELEAKQLCEKVALHIGI